MAALGFQGDAGSVDDHDFRQLPVDLVMLGIVTCNADMIAHRKLRRVQVIDRQLAHGLRNNFYGLRACSVCLDRRDADAIMAGAAGHTVKFSAFEAALVVALRNDNVAYRVKAGDTAFGTSGVMSGE